MDQPAFELSDLLKAADQYGLNNRLPIRNALNILQLYSLLERRGQQYRFVLTQFPHIARQVEDVPFLIESLLPLVEA